MGFTFPRAFPSQWWLSHQVGAGWEIGKEFGFLGAKSPGSLPISLSCNTMQKTLPQGVRKGTPNSGLILA